MEKANQVNGPSEVIPMEYDVMNEDNDMFDEGGEKSQFLQLKIEDDNISISSRRSEHPPDIHIREEDEHHAHTEVPKTRLQ
jgi:hypothetical protein